MAATWGHRDREVIGEGSERQTEPEGRAWRGVKGLHASAAKQDIQTTACVEAWGWCVSVLTRVIACAEKWHPQHAQAATTDHHL